MSAAATEKAVLAVRVVAPTNKLYDGPAVSITASNKVGQFDILYGHANFFSLLTAATVTINTGSQAMSFPISEGLLKVKNNAVTLFVNIASV
jgi:F0F1-type ATP synthase epsilon subunit